MSASLLSLAELLPNDGSRLLILSFIGPIKRKRKNPPNTKRKHNQVNIAPEINYYVDSFDKSPDIKKNRTLGQISDMGLHRKTTKNPTLPSNKLLFRSELVKTGANCKNIHLNL